MLERRVRCLAFFNDGAKAKNDRTRFFFFWQIHISAFMLMLAFSFEKDW